MRINQNTSIDCGNLVLVPYLERHVLKYHNWMKNPKLQELTCSEPLTLEEEFQMQKSWLEDEDKLTFIVIYRQGVENKKPQILHEILFHRNEDMIGDVNMFLTEGYEEVEDDPAAAEDENQNSSTYTQGELELMIAKPEYRGKGLGTTIAEAFLYYMEVSGLVASKGIAKYIIKVGSKNVPSLRLFKKIGFQQTKYVACFDQVEMEKPLH
ncbi:GCN5-like N-acetyltransferase [Schizosaccharomyces cryophilus OY26]|uniref:GCN5-like N-acetyltransferase n=1 Tax=Schizosaccharomyces cryophilus (strain OY26 / ATCC MYA-4695 / CBS 11777 / NBRC 106824 / NRRL Y48691) TaxID=653667 RepID=S9VTJ8_SCHCR|nr:GCN5-like N-acetyltransferase [Schizosaccharomyces cryophilus OY26]EPY49469.1 GCN5-like N-acetyltransferase [Schizosaccharomyces cryophilus OY26]